MSRTPVAVPWAVVFISKTYAAKLRAITNVRTYNTTILSNIDMRNIHAKFL